MGLLYLILLALLQLKTQLSFYGIPVLKSTVTLYLRLENIRGPTQFWQAANHIQTPCDDFTFGLLEY